ncbi:MAG: hypothetical protein AAFX93_11375 [Verrucomicrobiota bacterium]
MKITRALPLTLIACLLALPMRAATHDIWPGHDFDTRMNNILSVLNNFDTIRIHGNHTYDTDNGRFVINKDVEIIGDGLGVTRIRRTGSSTASMFFVTANGVRFEGLTMICNKLAKQGVHADGVSGLALVNVAIDKGYERPIVPSTGLPGRDGSLSAIYCTEGKSLPNLYVDGCTFKNMGWAGLYMGSGHGSAPLYTSSSYGGYFVINNCRFKRTSESYMRKGIAVDYGEDGLNYSIDFGTGTNPITNSRPVNDWKNYGWLGNSTFDQMVFYSFDFSRTKKILIENNDLRGGHWAQAQADDSRFPAAVHLENRCVSMVVNQNTIAEMGGYMGILLAGFFANDGNDDCKWIYITDNLFDGDALGVNDNMVVAISGGAAENAHVKDNRFNHNNTHPNGKIVAFWGDTSTTPTSYATANTKSNMTGNTVFGVALNKTTQVVVSQP